MGYDFEFAGGRHVVHPVHKPGRGQLSIEGRSFDVELFPGLAPGEHILEIAGRQERVFIAARGDVQYVHWRGRAHLIEAVNALERARRAASPVGGEEILRAPMPGTVVEVVVNVGDAVEQGTLLMTIESMKLQTAITAPHAATVAEVCVSTGSTFDQGNTLIRLEADIQEEHEEHESATEEGKK